MPLIENELLPLDDLLVDADLERFHPVALDLFRAGRGAADEKLMALPRVFSPMVIHYNRAHFRDAGLPDPDADWDWNVLETCVRRLSDPSQNRYGYLLGTSVKSFLPFIWQNGGDALDDAGARCRLSDLQTIEAVQFAQRLYHISPAYRKLSWAWPELFSMFCEGKFSMFPWGGGLRMRCCQARGLDWGIAPMPKGPYGRASVMLSEGYAISASTHFPERAAELVCELASSRSQEVLAAAGYAMVADRNAQELVEIEPAFRDMIDVSRIGYGMNFSPEMNVIRSELEAIWKSGEPQVAADACRSAQTIVDAMIRSRELVRRLDRMES